MATTTILWAGKDLDGQEEARLRKLVHTLRRAAMHELADDTPASSPSATGTGPHRNGGSAASPGPP